MLHPLKYYILHRLKSVHLHGIHSPFVFEFNRDCLQDVSNDAVYGRLVRFRESVINHPQNLQVEDHGAGSKKMHGSRRNTTDILKHNCSTLARTRLLYRIAAYFRVDRTLELGTSLGVGTHALALASQQVTSVEGSREVQLYAQQRLEESGVSNIELVMGTFHDFLDGKLSSQPSESYDLIFIDGHHDGEATLEYFERLLPYCHDGSVIIIDDIHWSNDMTRAWKKLTLHPQVTASINTFYWGILFLRKEQHQQAFYVKL